MENISAICKASPSICELTDEEVACISGAGTKQAGAALALAGAIGTTTFGSAWGAVAIGAAWAAAPIAVVAMVGLVSYAGFTSLRNGEYKMSLR